MLPRHLNAITVASRRPYALKTLSVPAQASSVFILHRFLPNQLAHWAVLGWRPFKATHSTSMSQRGHHGWGRFPYSTMITVSRTWRCTKCTRNPIHAAALPWNSLTRNSRVPATLVKDTHYV